MSILSDMPALLARNVALHGDAIAFIDDEREISYREFDGMVRNTVGWLQRQGIGEGDIVAVWLVNRIEWMALYFGLAHIGAAMMTVNTRYRSHEVEYILERSRAKMPDIAAELPQDPIFRQCCGMSVMLLRPASNGWQWWTAMAACRPRSRQPTVAFDMQTPAPATAPAAAVADALSILFTTSGTTSGPKLVMHPQRTVTLHSQNVARAYGFEEAGARLLAALPFCGVFGFSSAFATFAAGQPVVLMDTFDGPTRRN